MANSVKLEQQKALLMDVQTKLEKYHELGGAASTILTSFENRLLKLEATILPVYNETEHLQRRQQNLESTLVCLDGVLSHYESSQEVCNLIHLGPTENDITAFLEALEKLKRAQEYFLNNNPQSVELENVTSLFNTGCESLQNHFKFLLKKHCSPLKPVDLLDLIYVEEDSSNDDCPSIKQLPVSAREELQLICNWLDQNVRRDYVTIYATERADVVFRSLNNLKDHQKSGSWGAEPLKRGATAGGGYYAKGEQRKSTSARLQQIFERKANKMLQKASQTIEQSRFALKKSAENLLADEYLGADGNQDLEKYLVLLLGLQRLLIWERQILVDIVPSGRTSEVFSRLAQPSIDLVVRDVENITAKVIRSIGRKEWTAALGIFAALKDVIILQPDIERVCDVNQATQLGTVVTRLQQTGTRALEQFLELVRNESGGNLVVMGSGGASSVPRDATVHELTSNAIWFLEHLSDHWDVIGGILQSDSAYSNQLDAHMFHSPEEKKRALLGIYYKKALSELNLTIVSKCEQYGDMATRYLFRLNNIHYILKSLQRTNLLEIVSLAEPECEANYLSSIRDLKISYQKTWDKLLSHVGQLEELPRVSPGIKLKDKERGVIKDRFSSFNKELEEICRIQRSLSVPDIILREGLKRDNVENIVPKYNAFFEMFIEVTFSKSPEKYIKYRPEDLSNMLNSLFDDTV